jgi:hypothetical protein
MNDASQTAVHGYEQGLFGVHFVYLEPIELAVTINMENKYTYVAIAVNMNHLSMDESDTNQRANLTYTDSAVWRTRAVNATK